MGNRWCSNCIHKNMGACKSSIVGKPKSAEGTLLAKSSDETSKVPEVTAADKQEPLSAAPVDDKRDAKESPVADVQADNKEEEPLCATSDAAKEAKESPAADVQADKKGEESSALSEANKQEEKPVGVPVLPESPAVETTGMKEAKESPAADVQADKKG